MASSKGSSMPRSTRRWSCRASLWPRKLRASAVARSASFATTPLRSPRFWAYRTRCSRWPDYASATPLSSAISACACRSTSRCTVTSTTNKASRKPSTPMIGGARRDIRCRASSSARRRFSATLPFTAGRRTKRAKLPIPKGRAFPTFYGLAALRSINRSLRASPWEAGPPETTFLRVMPDSSAKPEGPVIKISRQHPSAIRAAVVLVTLTLYACNSAGAGTGANSSDAGDLGLIEEAIKQVERNYVAPVTDNELTKDALRGMLTRLDPHSDYMDQDQYQQMTAVTRGQFGGIGVELTLEGKVPEVISPIDGTPASDAGIEPGDRITKIDGQPTTGMDVEEIVKRLRGEPGTRVILTISRNDRAPFDLTLVRTIIRVVSVKSDLKGDNIGYARIAAFTESTPAELASAISHLKDRAHGRLNGLILDLRNDPGGLLDAAVEVAGDFIDGGVVVTTRGRTGQDDHVYRA